jgi:ribose transport system substrate-binding protein
MTLAMPPFDWLGWLAFDEMARAVLGEATPGYVIPARVVDADNVGGGTGDELFPQYVGYQDAFREAWTP